MSEISNQSWKVFVKFIEMHGCALDRIKGDHHVYIKKGIARPLVIPIRNPLPEFIVRNNLKILGLTVSDYKNFLNPKKK